MGVGTNKNNLFNKIGSVKSISERPKTPFNTSSLSSVSNTKDVVPFMLDVLKVVAGAAALKLLIGQLLTKVIDSSEPKIKSTLKSQFTHSNAGDPIPNSVGGGLNLEAKKIDATGKLKVSPTSTEGNLLYDSSKPNFDSVAYSVIANGDEKQFGPVSMSFNNSTDSFLFKPSALNVGDFFGGFIDNTEILNKKEIVSNVMDSIYGSISAKRKKTPEEIYEELQLQKLIEQLMAGDDSFEISQNDLDELLRRAQELSEGIVNYDMGCGLLPAQLSFDDMVTLISNISGSTDPFAVGNAIEASINQANSSDTTDENKETIKDGFFQKIIKALTVQLAQSTIASPQVRMLMGMFSAMQANGQATLSKAKDDMKQFKVMIKCMVNEIITLIGEFIFALVAAYLIKLVTPVITEIVRAKMKRIAEQIKKLFLGSKAAQAVDAASG
jgi:hypothetical protein